MPTAKVAQWTIHLTSTMVHWQTFTMNGFKWEMAVYQIPVSLSLPAEVDLNRQKDCDMSANQSRRSTASWVDFTNNQSTLTVPCSSCVCRSILHDIQCSSKRHACCHCDVAWDRTVVGAWTAWPSDSEDHPSVVSPSDPHSVHLVHSTLSGSTSKHTFMKQLLTPLAACSSASD